MGANPKRFIGVDPGANGGLAVIDADGSVQCVRMPAEELDLWRWVRDHAEKSIACVELVTGYVGDAGNPGSAMFKFGRSSGGVTMALTAAGIPFEMVAANAWQRSLGVECRGRGESKTSFKNRLKAKAQQLHPTIKVTLATADALLIATHCMIRWSL